MAIDVDRIGFIPIEVISQSAAPSMAGELAATFQPLDGTLTAYAGLVWAAGKQVPALTAADTLTLLSVGAASATDLIDRQSGDARYAASGSGVVTFNTRSGAVTLTSADVTGALTYTPTSVTGLTGVQALVAFKTGLGLTGTNSGDQTITLTGDVTGSGTGSFVATIGAGKVTLAMQANMATASVVYRKTAGAGAPEVQTLATLKTDLGLTGTNSGDQTTITGNAGTATTLQTGRTLAITGDLAWTSPSFNGSANVTAAGTLATVNSNVGAFGSTSAVPVITVNGKGLITAVTTAALGTMATQAASAVAITGGTATGLTQVDIAGIVTLTGNIAFPGTASANCHFYHSNTSGLVMYGEGSIYDHLLVNKAGSLVSANPTGTVHTDFGGYVKPGSFTVAGVPSAATSGAGAMIYVSNESGGAVIAFSDGASWRRVTDRAVIS